MRLPLVARGIDGSRVVVSSTSRRLGSVRSGSFCSAQVGRPLVHGLTRHELTEVATRKQPQQAESSPKQRYADPSGDPLVTVSDRVDRTPCRHWIRTSADNRLPVEVGRQRVSSVRRTRKRGHAERFEHRAWAEWRVVDTQFAEALFSPPRAIQSMRWWTRSEVHTSWRSVTFWPRAERGQSPVGATSRGRPRWTRWRNRAAVNRWSRSRRGRAGRNLPVRAFFGDQS